MQISYVMPGKKRISGLRGLRGPQEVLKISFTAVCLSMVILSVTGCAQCEKCNEKFVEVKVPVPQKCDLVLRPKPDINTSTLQSVYSTVTELALDGVELRKELDLVPCLNIIYKKSENFIYNLK